jgi:hypothetical protein
VCSKKASGTPCRLGTPNLRLPCIKSVLDSLNIFIGEIGKADRISSLRNRVSSIEFASDDGGQSHACRGNASDEND